MIALTWQSQWKIEVGEIQPDLAEVLKTYLVMIFSALDS